MASKLRGLGGTIGADYKVKDSLNWHFLRDEGVAPTGGIHANM